MTIYCVELRIAGLAIDVMMDVEVGASNSLVVPLDPELVCAMVNILRPGDVAVDGGAHHGYVSMIMAALVEERGKVFAVEPASETFAKLERNIALNTLVVDRVTCIGKPLWSREEKVTLHLCDEDPGQHSLAHLDKHTTGTEELLATTIDAMGIKPKLVKLDVEGAEVAALRGAVDTIVNNSSYVICEMNPWSLQRFGETQHTLRNFAKDKLGYNTYFLSRFHAYPVYVPEGVEVVTPIQNINVLMATHDMVRAVYPELHAVLSLQV